MARSSEGARVGNEFKKSTINIYVWVLMVVRIVFGLEKIQVAAAHKTKQ